MALTLGSWPQATGFDTASYIARMEELFQFMMPEGVLPSGPSDILGAYTNEMLPFGDSTGMQVKIYQGRAFAKGIFAKINDADVSGGIYTLPVTAAHATLYRMDTIIVRYTLASGVAVLQMLDGTAGTLASGPQPTAITQNATTWDIIIGYVYVAPAVVTITASDVKDMRVFSSTLAEQLRVRSVDNPFINAGCKISQRGGAVGAIASGTYTTDRWLYSKTGAVVHSAGSVTGDTSLGTALLAAGQVYSTTCYSCVVTTADAAVAAGDSASVSQPIEGYIFEPFYRGKFTHRFWVRDTVVGMHAVAYQNAGASPPTPDRSCVMEYEIFAADTWEEKIIHVPASPNAGTWDFANGVGLRVIWPNYGGTTFATAPGVWQTGNFLVAFNADGTTVRTVNSAGTINNIFRVYGSNARPGNYCPPYAPRPFPLELLPCMRYYECSYQYGVQVAPTPPTALGSLVNVGADARVNGGIWYSQQFRVPKRAAPAMTIHPYTTPANTSRITLSSLVDQAANSGVPSANATEFNVANNSGGTLTTSGGYIYFGWQAPSEL